MKTSTSQKKQIAKSRKFYSLLEEPGLSSEEKAQLRETITKVFGKPSPSEPREIQLERPFDEDKQP